MKASQDSFLHAFLALFSLVLVAILPQKALSIPCSQALKKALTYRTHAGAQDSFGTQQCPLERDIITWHFMKEGTHPGSFHTYQTFLERHKTWPWAFKIRREAEKRLGAQDLKRNLKAWFRKTPPQTFEGATALIRKTLASGHKAEARRLTKDLWVSIAFSTKEADRYLKQFGSMLTQDDHFKRARSWLRQGTSHPAQHTLKLLSSPSSRLLLKAQIALLKQTPHAPSLYHKASKRHKTDGDLKLFYLQWLRRTYHAHAAKYLIHHPEIARHAPEKAWQEAHILLRRALEEGRPHLALRLAKGHALTKGSAYAEAQWLKGWLTLRYEKKPRAALKIFEATYPRMKTPISRARFAFWAGVAAESLDPRTSRKWYDRARQHPGTFYGQRAAEKRGQTAAPPLFSLRARHDLIKRVKNTRLLKAADTLLKAGHPSRAQTFLYMLMKSATTPEEQDALLKVVGTLSPDHVVGLAKEASPQRDLYFKELYPVLSKHHAQAMKAVDPALFHSILRKESTFDTQLVSSAGALGLSQLLPSTAKEVARTLGLPFNRKKLLRDKVYNTRLGATYLASRLQKFEGNVLLGLVAYNAGIKYAYDWQKLFGNPRNPHLQSLDWIESLPFGETRNYVQRVLEAQKVYRCLLQKQCARAAASFSSAVPLPAFSPLKTKRLIEDTVPLPPVKPEAPYS